MGVIAWVRRLLERDDGYEPDPDEVVTAGHVQLTLRPVGMHELELAGLHAHAVEERAPHFGVARARILCFAPDRDAVAAVVERVMTDYQGDGSP